LVPGNYATPPHVLSYQILSTGSNGIDVRRGSQNISGTLGPRSIGTGALLEMLWPRRPWGCIWGVADPIETRPYATSTTKPILSLSVKPFGRRLVGVSKNKLRTLGLPFPRGIGARLEEVSGPEKKPHTVLYAITYEPFGVGWRSLHQNARQS